MEDIFERLQSGSLVELNDSDFYKVDQVVAQTLALLPAVNAATAVGDVRTKLSHVFGFEIDATTTIFPPFHTNFGRSIKLGKHVFINHACSFLDMGGITLEDHVLIGPRVTLVTEGHPLNPTTRRGLICKPILIKNNAWIGAGATILPGVTIGAHAVVAAGAVVNSHVADYAVVGGVPAKVIKTINP